MNQSQMNRKHMFETTLAFMDENAASWQAIAKIGEVKNELSGVVAQIDTLAKEQDGAAIPVGKSKAALKRTIATKADIVNDLVEVYALMEGNTELAQSMGDSATDLYRMKNDDFIRRVQLIMEKTNEHAEALKNGYGLTDEQIAGLQADLDQYLELNGMPRMYKVKSVVATMGLDDLFTMAADLLSNKLDNLMKIFKRSNPALFNGYQKARMVVDY